MEFRGWPWLSAMGLVCGLALLTSGCGSSGGGGASPPAGSVAPPVAEAGPDRSVAVGTPVTLDGSLSSGPSGLLTYAWTLNATPAGSTAMLNDATTARPRFTPDVAGPYTITLVVTHAGVMSAPDTVIITAGSGNLPPVAQAGADRAVLPGSPVTLDGSASYDPNGTPLTYEWTLQRQPPGSSVSLLQADSATPTVTPTTTGEYVLALRVHDGEHTSAPALITITVATGNLAPVAHAGPDQTVTTGVLVTLTAAESHDPNGDPLTYSWQLQSKPAGSRAALADAASVHPSLTPDVAGLYVLSLMVHDGHTSSPADTVVIEARLQEIRGFNAPVSHLVSASDGTGDIYVAGAFTAYQDQPVRTVVRLRPNGTLHSFQLPLVITGGIRSIAEADDGSGDLYVAEVFAQTPQEGVVFHTRTGRVWRLHSDGTPDPGFAVGTAQFANAEFYHPSVISTLASTRDHSGRVYVGLLKDSEYAGRTRGAIIRLSAEGQVDPNFDASDVTSYVLEIHQASDGTGRIYIKTMTVAPRDWVLNLALLHGNGRVDPTFEFNALTYRLTTIGPIAPTDDGTGDLLADGIFLATLAAGFEDLFALEFVRFNPDGTLDLTSPKPDVSGRTAALTKTADGSGAWLLAKVADSQRHQVLRFRSDGPRDPTFTVGETVGVVTVIMPAPDDTGDIYLGGAITSYNGVAVGNLVRIRADGTLVQ
jgi:hypothetical protein